jgi:hypothetical protein
VVVLSHNRFALDLNNVGAALALVIAIVSMPMMCGWVIADSRCTLTMDICHPARSLDIGHAPLMAPAPLVLATTSDAVVSSVDGYRAMVGRLGDGPVLPPPKIFI